ncbi:MAG: ATP-dependent RNA helicase RhlE [Paraglaciecola sp.]|jgi:ATP-dependent RNA helicase RhlE
MPFTALGLPSAFQKALSEQNITKPTPIQEAAIPVVLQGRDVLGIAQTGSGKTASFVLPVLTNLQKDTRLRNRQVKVLVVVPTRELAVQINEVFWQFNKVLPERVKSLAVFGGVSINPQMKALQNTHILVATPGRLIELVESNAVSLKDVETLVLDEADKLLNKGFKEELHKILSFLPKKRQNLLFSATLSKDVANIQDILLKNPVVVKVEPPENHIDLITQSAWLVTDEKKGPLLRYLIRENNMEQVLVFTSSVYKANNVVDKLKKNGVVAMAIHSKKSQGARTEALHLFKTGKLSVLVTTDLLSRGIDIEFLPYVINYELPRSPKDYIHRIGRTGRAENAGEAISLVTEEDLHHFKVIQKKMKKWVALSYSEELDLKGY